MKGFFNIYKQRYDYDCVLACVSTLLQKDYAELFSEEIIKKAEEEKGLSVKEALDAAKLQINTDYWEVFIPYEMASSGNLKRLLNGRRAIIIVPSLNNWNAQHAVYWHGETLYDPSNKQTYTWLDHLIPRTIFIFNEILCRKLDYF